ncbi:MAG: HDIG domain-containing protein [Oscillospiraceae bacterium]|nr:HDIG domain-containing protein [Oscillospiraceae bacterium]
MKGAGGARGFHKNPAFFSIIIAAAAYLTLTAIMTMTLAPEQYDLRAGDIAPKTIVATKDIVDEYTTQHNRDTAASAVQPTYSEREGAREQSLELLDSIFNSLESARALGEALRTGTGRLASASDDGLRPAVTRAPNGVITRDQYDIAALGIPELSMSAWQMTILMGLDEAALSSVREVTSRAVLDAMDGTIVEGQVDGVISAIQRQLISNMSADLCWNIAVPVVRACVMPNMVVNQEATDLERDRIRREVEPVYYKQGQNIVTAGNRITEQQLALMNSLGLIRGNEFDRVLFGGACILVALVMMMFIIHLYVFERHILQAPKFQLLMLVIALITIGLSFAFQSVSPYLAPLSVGALLAVATLPSSLAWTFNIVTAILVGFVSKGSGTFSQQIMHVIVHGIMGGAIGVYVLSNHPRRLTTLLAGLYIALFNLVSMFALGFITNSSMESILQDALFSFGGGVIAAVLSMGLQPALEWAFNLVTPAKLLELANPNHPLLRRMMLETPGTYQHSLMVANLAEAAADAIGANALLVRVGAYYHDIGKLIRPQFFKENQLGENPHDALEPQKSASIVLAHVTDGLALAQKHRLPPVIKDLIAQHHGDTPVVYFYKQACKLSADGTADISKFRYNEKHPQTAEAAILMLADSVEAAIRSMPDPTGEKIQQGIKSIVQQKMSDGQLDDAPINFRDLNVICKAFSQALNGLYHQRIEYPAFDIRQETNAPDSSILLYASIQNNRDGIAAGSITAPVRQSFAAPPKVGGKA